MSGSRERQAGNDFSQQLKMCQILNFKSAHRQISLPANYLLGFSLWAAIVRWFIQRKICGCNLHRAARKPLFTSVTWAKLRGAAMRTFPLSRIASAAIGVPDSSRDADSRPFAETRFPSRLAILDCFTTRLNTGATLSAPCSASVKILGTITRASSLCAWATKLSRRMTFCGQRKMIYRPSF
jgi:hypothetical protein